MSSKHVWPAVALVAVAILIGYILRDSREDKPPPNTDREAIEQIDQRLRKQEFRRRQEQIMQEGEAERRRLTRTPY